MEWAQVAQEAKSFTWTLRLGSEFSIWHAQSYSGWIKENSEDFNIHVASETLLHFSRWGVGHYLFKAKWNDNTNQCADVAKLLQELLLSSPQATEILWMRIIVTQVVCITLQIDRDDLGAKYESATSPSDQVQLSWRSWRRRRILRTRKGYQWGTSESAQDNTYRD